jgi:aspartyl-tRNA(Asn)/glutamyl-tRNA(Gln) amidotransferase subunit B
MNQAGLGIEEIRVKPEALAGLTRLVATGTINQNTAKSVLAEMFESGESAEQIVDRRGLKQVSDADQVAALVEQVLAEYPDQVASYLAGKETVSRWLFGQVMRLAKGQANPQVIQQVLDERLLALKNQSPPEKM